MSKTALRLYEGAKIGRLTADWLAGGTSADAEISSSMVRLRNRARQVIRDSDHARQAIRTIKNNVVGTGVKLQAQVRRQRARGGALLDTEVNERIEQRWKAWTAADRCHAAGKLSFQDIERLVIGSAAESGEVFVRMVPRPFGDSRVPLALELIEADQLDETVDSQAMVPGQMVPGGEWRMGVHVDEWQRPIEYAFLTSHPGDIRGGAGGRKRVIVPASEILHIFTTERPGQTRGVTWFASAVKQLHHLAGYQEAEVVRARAASSLMGFITTSEGAGEELGEDVVDGEHVTTFEPGVIKTLFAGQDITIPDLHAPDGQFEPFVRAMLRAMAAGLGISYSSLSKDFSDTNYSSSRLSLLEDRENWRVLQQYMIRHFHERVYRAWLRAAVSSGDLQLPAFESMPERYEQVQWVARGWEFVDPQKEVAAYAAAVRSGFMTRAEVVMARGGDWHETIQGLANEKAELDKLGLVLDTDPSLVNEKGDQQPPEVAAADAGSEPPPG